MNLLETPFFKHDGAEVEIAAAGNVRLADNTYIGYEPKVVIHFSRFNLSIERGCEGAV
jgi:hypothetical protein